MSKDDKAIFYHKPQTFQWTPADGVFSFGENRKDENMIRYYSVPKETFVTNGTIVEPLEVTENGTYAPPAGTAYSPVVVNVEGGGGSSDFSTAEVTITNNSGEEVAFYLPIYVNIPEYGAIIQGFVATDSEEPTFDGEVVIPTNGQLYVGSSLAQFTTGNTSVTGNATVENGSLIITGDCTITIS